jgi:hypothetical protein
MQLAPIVAFGFLGMTGQRLDADNTGLFARQLEFIYSETYDIEYPENKARTFFPVDNRVPAAAESYTYRTFDRKGSARLVNNFATDFPTVEMVGYETTQKVKSLGDSYIYSIQEMRAAAMAGVPLDAMKARAARDVMEYELERIAWTGDSNSGLYGVLSAPGVMGSGVAVTDQNGTSQAAASVLTSTGDWGTLNAMSGLVPLDIINDVTKMSKAIFDATKGIHRGDTLVLDTASYSKLANAPRAAGFTNDTVLQYVLSASPWLKTIDFSPRLDNASGLVGGTLGKPRIVMFERNPRVVGLIIPQEFEQLAPQPRNMAFVVNCHMRFGGAEVRYPKAVATMDGVAG